MGLEKSLVYFSTSLKSNEVTLEKILRGRIIKLYDEDEDLLEDVIIEVKQAIEMCSIYSNVLSNTMDAFSSIINNNLNIVMKLLAALTIIMELPNIIFGLYGTNVGRPALPAFLVCAGAGRDADAGVQPYFLEEGYVPVSKGQREDTMQGEPGESGKADRRQKCSRTMSKKEYGKGRKPWRNM